MLVVVNPTQWDLAKATKTESQKVRFLFKKILRY